MAAKKEFAAREVGGVARLASQGGLAALCIDESLEFGCSRGLVAHLSFAASLDWQQGSFGDKEALEAKFV